MESDTVRPTESSSRSKATQRQIQLGAIARELSSITGRSKRELALGTFAALVRATGVKSGRLFLTGVENRPELCLILADGQLSEYDTSASPSPLVQDLHQQGLAGEAFLQCRGILISDTATDARWSAEAEFPEAPAARSAVAAPILAATQSLGAVALIAAHPQHFDETDLSLISAVAAQMALVLENARLNRLLAESQNTIDALRQTAHTISTATDRDQALGTILKQFVRSVSYRQGMLLLIEGAKARPVAALGFDDVDQLFRRSFVATDIPALFQILNEGHTIVNGDETQAEELIALGFPEPPARWAVAPLVSRRTALGLVVIAGAESHNADDQEIATVNAFADQLAITIANHHLVEELDRRLQELAFLKETGQAITSTLNLDHILQLLLEHVRELLQINATSIALRNERTGELVFEAASGTGAAEVIGVRLEPGQGIAGWVAETGKPLLVRDVYNDPRFYAGIDRKTGLTTQAILCIPIVLKGRVVGVIEALDPDQVTFDDQAIELLTALSGLAASAIHNARLFAQVRSAEARYEGLFEDNVNPIIITDLDGVIVEANRNAYLFLGQSKQALRGTNLTQISSADGNLDIIASIDQIRTGREVVFQTKILSGGQWRAVEVSGKQIRVEGTALIQWIGRDISAEIELEQTREDMVRMVVHDLRNPLANIMNSLDVLHDVLMENDDSVSIDELLSIARRSGQRMHQLISSILDISRLETGQAILETRPTDLVALMEEALEFIKPQTDIRDIDLVAKWAPNLPQVEIDPDMISRVMINLLDNASKFTPMDGKINVTANRQTDKVEITVADDGPGIPLDQLESIFEKFTRVQHQDGPEGTGLGLAFCKLAVENHGGQIWAESAQGRGSTFHFTLPIKT